MSVVSVCGPNGRYPGSFVYIMQSDLFDNVLIKIGISDNPKKRITHLMHSSPCRVVNAVTIHVYTRQAALDIEAELLREFRPWKIRGEWMSFKRREKDFFNGKVREILDKYRKPGWPMKLVNPYSVKHQAEKLQLEYFLPAMMGKKPDVEGLKKLQDHLYPEDSCFPTAIVG